MFFQQDGQYKKTIDLRMAIKNEKVDCACKKAPPARDKDPVVYGK